MVWETTDPINKRRQGVMNVLPTSLCALDKLCPEPWTLNQGQPTTPALQMEGLTVPGEKVTALTRPTLQVNTLPQFWFPEEGVCDQVIPDYRIFWSDHCIRMAGTRSTSLGLFWPQHRGVRGTVLDYTGPTWETRVPLRQGGWPGLRCALPSSL